MACQARLPPRRWLKGTLLNAPDVYKQKIATGPRYGAGVVELDAPAADKIRRFARAEGVPPSQVAAWRWIGRGMRHDCAIRSTGRAVRLICDGNVAGAIHTGDPEYSSVDIHMNTGGAPEGVLAAPALRCIGGQMQCRLVLDTDEKRERAAKMGVTDPRMIFGIEDMVRGDRRFAATGVTDVGAGLGL